MIQTRNRRVKMARARNHVIYNPDQAYLERLREEYIDYIGREGKLEKGKLTIFALRRKRNG